jgi:hypothetical protein
LFSFLAWGTGNVSLSFLPTVPLLINFTVTFTKKKEEERKKERLDLNMWMLVAAPQMAYLIQPCLPSLINHSSRGAKLSRKGEI